MNKTILFLALSFNVLSCNIDRRFASISRSIDTSFKSYPPVGYNLVASNDRIFLYKGSHLNFLNLSRDTFFCLQEADVSTGNIYTFIWNENGEIGMLNEGKNKRTLLKDSSISTLISNPDIKVWDTAFLKNKYIRTELPSELRLSRIVIDGQNINIESILLSLLPDW